MEQALPLDTTPAWRGSKLGRAAPDWVSEALTTRNSTPNFHLYGVNETAFAALPSLRLLATSEDAAGERFAAVLEHEAARVFAVQWHPEAYLTIGNSTASAAAIDFSADGVALMEWVARFFVEQARESGRGPERLINATLIDLLPSSADGKDYELRGAEGGWAERGEEEEEEDLAYE